MALAKSEAEAIGIAREIFSEKYARRPGKRKTPKAKVADRGELLSFRLFGGQVSEKVRGKLIAVEFTGDRIRELVEALDKG